MHIAFDNLDELREFLDFTGYSKRDTASVALAADPRQAAISALDRYAEAGFPGAMPPRDEIMEPIADVPAGTPLSVEVPKRKRRTKAEMEAERAASAESPVEECILNAEASALAQQANAEAAEPETKTAPRADDNPFQAAAESPATQAILNAPDGRTATLAGIAAMQEASAGEAATPADFIDARAAELIASGKVPKPVDHMKNCSAFVAAHSRDVYASAFELAGLPSTIAAYKEPQIARHMAAMEYIALNA